MIDQRVKKVAADIKSIKIQGALNIARAGVEVVLRTEASAENIAALASARPTEPALFNSLHLIRDAYVSGGPAVARKTGNRLLKYFVSSKKSIALNGKKLIRDGMTVLNTCHSSSVVQLFKEASKTKDFKVIVNETRPLYQGRRTAREIRRFIDTTLILDSEVNSILPDVDLVIVGCDALTPKGLINKIGTSQIATLARVYRRPFYAAAELLKYGKNIEIEHRSPDEVGRIPGVHILNPAFDLTPQRYIKGVISEKGILTYSRSLAAARSLLRSLR